MFIVIMAEGETRKSKVNATEKSSRHILIQRSTCMQTLLARYSIGVLSVISSLAVVNPFIRSSEAGFVGSIEAEDQRTD